MRQRYIDFVPVDKQGAWQGTSVVRGVARPQARVSQTQVVAVQSRAEMGQEVVLPDGSRTIRGVAVRRAPMRSGTSRNIPVSKKPVSKAMRNDVSVQGISRRNTVVDRVSRGAMMEKRVTRVSDTIEVSRTSGSGLAQRTEFSIEKTAELGVVQDLNTHFTQTEVEKRPLSRGLPVQKSEVATVKAEKVGNKAKKIGQKLGKPARSAKISAQGQGNADNPKGIAETMGAGVGEMKRANTGGTKAMGTYVPPKGKFMPQTRVEKRPLSKTVYSKKVVTPKEEPQGPVTIIAKPEKQNHAGLIVTIILTIILGAAAGTVAFLLLPK